MRWRGTSYPKEAKSELSREYKNRANRARTATYHSAVTDEHSLDRTEASSERHDV